MMMYTEYVVMCLSLCDFDTNGTPYFQGGDGGPARPIDGYRRLGTSRVPQGGGRPE